MGKVSEILLDEAVRPRVIEDCAKLVDEEVAAKKGATGLFIKAGYKSFKTVKPGIVPAAAAFLLPEFAAVMDRYHERFLAEGQPGLFAEWLSSRADQVAEDLLAITDLVVAKSEVTGIKPIYSGLRKIGKKNVAAAVPAIGRLIARYTA